MKVEDVDEALIDSVCARLHEQLHDGDATCAEAFARQYYRWVSPEDLAERTAIDLYGAALAHFNLARNRTPGEPKLRVYNPQFDQNGWQSTHTAVEIVTDDMPFLIDSVTMELNRHGFGVHLIIHPVMTVHRDKSGALQEVLPPHPTHTGTEIAESVIHAEVTRHTDPAELNAMRGHLLRVIGEVRAAVEDWPAMRQQALNVAQELDSEKLPNIDAAEVKEVKSFLTWLEDHHFTFLGYRDYAILDDEGTPKLTAIEGSGLGILRRPSDHGARALDDLPPGARERALDPTLLNLTKANSRSIVHRPSYMDYVGVKKFDDSGHVTGERRFLGLYAFSAYSVSVFEIPIVRRKVGYVLERAGFPEGSHNEKDLLEILETYPRDELFQISKEELFDIAMGILHLQERQHIRLFVRRDTYGRFFSCLVFVPRERYNTEIRRRMQDILQGALGGANVDFNVRLSESVLARLHFIIYTQPGEVPDYDAEIIEERLVEATRSWTDNLYDALIEQCGEERGTELFHRYRGAFPPGYRNGFLARTAVADIHRIEDLESEDDIEMSLYHPIEEPENFLGFKLFGLGEQISLSDILPLLEDMGVEVVDERPHRIKPAGSPSVWIYDFGLVHGAQEELQTGEVREIFQDAFARAWRGTVENDGFNRLVLRARLTWRKLTVLRAYCKYLRQAGTTFSQNYMEDALFANPHIARLHVVL